MLFISIYRICGLKTTNQLKQNYCPFKLRDHVDPEGPEPSNSWRGLWKSIAKETDLYWITICKMCWNFLTYRITLKAEEDFEKVLLRRLILIELQYATCAEIFWPIEPPLSWRALWKSIAMEIDLDSWLNYKLQYAKFAEIFWAIVLL